jgi:hypothetical protein
MALQDVPQPNQTLNATQNPIRQNFIDIDVGVAADHITLATGADSGKHAKVRFVQQAVDPLTTPTEMAMYTKDTGLGIQQIFIRKQNNGALFPFTQTSSTGITQNGASSGWSYLPSGIILKWGRFTTAGGTVTINTNAAWAVGNPAYTSVFSVQLTPNQNATVWLANNGISVGVPKTITVNASVAVTSFLILIIGN